MNQAVQRGKDLDFSYFTLLDTDFEFDVWGYNDGATETAAFTLEDFRNKIKRTTNYENFSFL